MDTLVVSLHHRERRASPRLPNHPGTLSTLLYYHPVLAPRLGRGSRSVEDLACGTSEVLAHAALEEIHSTKANHCGDLCGFVGVVVFAVVSGVNGTSCGS